MRRRKATDCSPLQDRGHLHERRNRCIEVPSCPCLDSDATPRSPGADLHLQTEVLQQVVVIALLHLFLPPFARLFHVMYFA